MRQTHNVPPGATVEDSFPDGAMVSIRLFVSLKRAQRCETASAARLVQLIVRRAVSHAPSIFGGSADNMRRQVPVLMTMAQRHSFSSFAIASVKLPGVVTLRNDLDPDDSSGRDNEFGAELISDVSLFEAQSSLVITVPPSINRLCSSL